MICRLIPDLVVATMFVGCSSDPESSPRDAEKVVSELNTSVPLVVPDTVKSGVPFTVTFATTEGGCNGADTVNVAVVGNGATITPYDTYVGGPMIACPADLIAAVPRSASLQFSQLGSAEVTVQGANSVVVPGAPFYLVTLTRSVVVSQ